MKTVLKIFFLTSLTSLINAQSADEKWIDACAGLRLGEYENAYTAFTELAKYDHTRAGRLWLYKGIAEVHTGRLTEAKNDLKNAMQSQLAEANLWLAKAYLMEGKQPEAITYLKTYFSKSTYSERNQVLHTDDFQDLLQSKAWQIFQQEYANDIMHDLNADVEYYISKRKFREADLALDRFPGLNEANQAEVHALRSKVYFSESSIQLALNEINQAVEFAPQQKDYKVLKIEYLLALNENNKALYLLNDLLEQYPEDFDIRLKRVSVAMSTNNLELASQDMEIVMKYFPSAENRFLSGEIDYESGRYLNAMKTFSRLIEEEEPRAEYFKARGMTYFQTRTLDQAAYDLSMSLDLIPDDAEVNFYLALTEKRRGNHSLACYYMTRAANYGEARTAEYKESFCK